MQDRGQVEWWSDARLNGGDLVEDDIKGAIDRSSVFLYLVSSDFNGSEFIRGKEFPWIQQRIANLAAEGKTFSTIPVFLRPCEPLIGIDDRDAVPKKNGRRLAITKHVPRDDGFLQALLQTRAAIEKKFGGVWQ